MSNETKIILTNGEECIVDLEDYGYLSKYTWHLGCNFKGVKRYAVRTVNRGDKILMHRFIMKAKKGSQVDHINGNKLDNRKINLRVCTFKENQHNTPPSKRNKSGYKGVCFCKDRGVWQSQIRKQFLGYFSNKLDAAKAYDSKAKEIYGEFAYINIK